MEKMEDDKHQKESKLVTIICIIFVSFCLYSIALKAALQSYPVA